MKEWLKEGTTHSHIQWPSVLPEVLRSRKAQKNCLTYPYVPELGINAITVLWARIQFLQMSSYLIKKKIVFCLIFFFSPKRDARALPCPMTHLICLLSLAHLWLLGPQKLGCHQGKRLLINKLMCIIQQSKCLIELALNKK